MSRHIFERAGILIGVVYTMGIDGVPEFTDARVLGADYRPVGPNIKDLMDQAYLVDTQKGEGQTMLSAVADELAVAA